MKTVKHIFAASAALILLFTGTAKAQEKARNGFDTGRFADNWFIDGGAGVNAVYDNLSFGNPRVAADLGFGKWFLPQVGVRIGVHGVRNVANNVATGWFSGDRTFWFGHIDADFLWHMSNTIGGYKPQRAVNFIPYARFAGILAADNKDGGAHMEFGAGGGLRTAFRLASRVDLNIDLGVLASREKAFRESGGFVAFPSATAGLTVRVGKQGFRRKHVEIIRQTDTVETIVTKVVPGDTVVVMKEVKDSVLIEKLRSTPLTLYFEIDKTFLTDRELAHLEFYVQNVVTPDMKLVLVGSADKDTGNKKHNQELSEGRAEYVKNILLNTYHIRPENIRTVAEGDWNNIYNTPEKNRVVTVYIDKEVIRVEGSAE